MQSMFDGVFIDQAEMFGVRMKARPLRRAF
jgi:hypothetical protein